MPNEFYRLTNQSPFHWSEPGWSIAGWDERLNYE